MAQQNHISLNNSPGLKKARPATESVQPAAVKNTGSQSHSIQTKLSIGSVDDPQEQEADQVADRVMRMPEAGFIQRKCAHCEEEEKQLQRKPSTPFIQKKNGEGNNYANDSISAQIESGRGKGNALNGDTKSFMESAFRADFSGVHIHTGTDAAQMSRELNAQAFTVGSDIYFNSGKFAPDTSAGKQLLVHELTHTIQQTGGIGRKIQRDVGTAVYQDTVSSLSTNTGSPGIYEGSVNRQQFRNDADRQANRNAFYDANVNVRFDATQCKFFVPVKVKFVNPSASVPTTCGGSGNDAVRTMNATDFRRIADRYISTTNDMLNDWYNIHLSNASSSPCNDHDIPIQVDVTEVTSGEDYTVIITGASGRSYVSFTNHQVVLCDDPGSGTMAHEGGHMALGANDEYGERSEPWRPAERERETDFSWMARSGRDRLSIFHARHFSFATAFLQRVYPNCTATLVETGRRRWTPEFNLSFGAGGTGNQYPALYYSLGLQMGIPLTRLRSLVLNVGPVGTIQLGFDTNNTIALLAGFRLGLSGSVDATILNRRFPIGLGAYGEAGAGFILSTTTPSFPRPGDRPPLTGRVPYLETGASIGYRGNLFSVEGTAGVGVIDPGNPAQMEYFRVGLVAAFRL
jgi:hypothetical protein